MNENTYKNASETSPQLRGPGFITIPSRPSAIRQARRDHALAKLKAEIAGEVEALRASQGQVP